MFKIRIWTLSRLYSYDTKEALILNSTQSFEHAWSPRGNQLGSEERIWLDKRLNKTHPCKLSLDLLLRHIFSSLPN